MKVTPQTTLSDIQKWMKKNKGTFRVNRGTKHWEVTITIWDGDMYEYFEVGSNLSIALGRAIREIEKDKECGMLNESKNCFSFHS